MVQLPQNHVSCVLLVDSPAESFENIKEQLNVQRRGREIYRAVFSELFKLADAQEVVRLSSLQTDSVLWLLVGAQSYSEIAQNHLLKSIEEPPKGIFYLFLAPNKSSLLPTIRSRLPIIDYRTKMHPAQLPFDVQKLDMRVLYQFVKELSKERPNKEEMKEKIAALLLECTKFPLDSDDLACFDKAIKLAEQFGRPDSIFVPLLLRILHKKARR